MKQLLTSKEIMSVAGGGACDPTYLGEALTTVALWLRMPDEKGASEIYCHYGNNQFVDKHYTSLSMSNVLGSNLLRDGDWRFMNELSYCYFYRCGKKNPLSCTFPN